MKYQIISWTHAAQRANNPLNEIEFFNLACTPHNEICTPAGDNHQDQIAECTALISQLIRQEGTPPEGAEFFIVRNEHEFGTYYEAGIFYLPSMDMDEETASEIYASKVECDIPENWDPIAVLEKLLPIQYHYMTGR